MYMYTCSVSEMCWIFPDCEQQNYVQLLSVFRMIEYNHDIYGQTSDLGYHCQLKTF